MKIIRVTTLIAAPVERCFRLSTSIDLHLDTAKATRETAIDGVTRGLIHEGDTVTWRGRHFGRMFTHQSMIESYRPYTHFRDVMLRGAFRLFEHDHYFAAMNDGTRMRDELRFSAPLGFLGRVAEGLFLERHLLRFLRRRNAMLKRIAESNEGWKPYLQMDAVELSAVSDIVTSVK